VRVYTLATGTVSYCGCLDPESDCTGNFQSGMCPGLCPSGTACYGEPEPAGLGNCVGCLPLVFPSTTAPTTTTPTTSSTSTTILSTPCGGTYPFCNGSCAAGEYCSQNEPGGEACVCVPLGLEPCGGATYPTCDGTCSGGAVCGPVRAYISHDRGFESCVCLDPASTCSGTFNDAMCPGVCPEGKACNGEPEPAGFGYCLGCLPLWFP
jgi:hypothetical protein